MLNPYALLYDSEMDIYRCVSQDTGDFTDSAEVLVGSGIACRYSVSSQVAIATPVPRVASSNILFCSLDTDILEGDIVVIRHKITKKVTRLQVGEGIPYTYQWQFSVKRDDVV